VLTPTPSTKAAPISRERKRSGKGAEKGSEADLTSRLPSAASAGGRGGGARAASPSTPPSAAPSRRRRRACPGGTTGAAPPAPPPSPACSPAPARCDQRGERSKGISTYIGRVAAAGRSSARPTRLPAAPTAVLPARAICHLPLATCLASSDLPPAARHRRNRDGSRWTNADSPVANERLAAAGGYADSSHIRSRWPCPDVLAVPLSYWPPRAS
jgi:hypothetical protein